MKVLGAIYAVATFVALLPTAAAQHVHELGFVATLNSLSELPANGSPGVGFARVQINLALFTMSVQVDFQGLAGGVTSATIRGATATPGAGLADAISPLPTLPAFPLGGTFGAYDQTLNLGLESSYNSGFIAATGGTVSLASNALFSALAAGKTYLELTSTAFVGGEIRGFLLPTPKPDFDFNGVVAGPDLTVWRESYAFEHYGDATGDGFSTGDDFLAWQQQLGAVATLPDGGHHHAVAVPEPTAALLAALAVYSVIALRKINRIPQKHAERLSRNSLATPRSLGEDTSAESLFAESGRSTLVRVNAPPSVRRGDFRGRASLCFRGGSAS